MLLFVQPCFGVLGNLFGLGGPLRFWSNGLALGGTHLGWPAYAAMEPILAGIWAPMGMRAGPMEPILAGMTFGMALAGGQAGMGLA